MKICKIYLKGFQQFQDVELDFTHPETEEPLEKICFIGSNGTGKSTLLKLIDWSLSFASNSIKTFSFHDAKISLINRTEKSILLFEFLIKNRKVFYLISGKYSSVFDFDKLSKEEVKTTIKTIVNGKFEDILSIIETNRLTSQDNNRPIHDNITLKDDKNDLLIFSPAEGVNNGYNSINDVPETTVNDALDFSRSFPFYALVASDTINTFWKILVYNLRKRAEERDAYENIPTNLVKTKAQLIKEFDEISPKILNYLNVVWDRILSKAGLYFDVNGANNPYQLNDNLKAYIKLKGVDKTIPYNEISTGIRNFIFRVGHIFSLYFNREIDRGFLLVDEPENSLYPDFLFDLVEVYKQIIIDKRGQNNTQMFFATHNPIIAAQFKPHERIILAWKEDGTVKTYKGEAPEGDDPNDVLKKDFGVRELMGQKGIEEWNKYLGLKSQLKKADTIDEKMELAAEINEVGRLYNFPA